MKISVILCAAGRGERAGLGRNKLLYPFLGANALYYSLGKIRAFGKYLEESGGRDKIDKIIVTAAKEDIEEISAVCGKDCVVVPGGDTRMQSVYNALLAADGDLALIHDGARPFTSLPQFAACLSAAKECGGAVLAMPVTDTIAVQKDGWVADIPRRSDLYAVQTPQIFDAKKLKYAYEKAMESGEIFTDDGSVYSRFVSPVKICPEGSAENKKLTYRSDFEVESPIKKLAVAGGKTGYGVDVHAFGKKCGYITLCGVKIQSESGLIAHSDGDVALHAVMDALLSAAGLDDIGHYFPENDPRYEGADSAKLLGEVIAMLAGKNLKPLSLSVAIQAERPRLSPYIGQMRQNLSALTGAQEDCVSITAGTCEGLGFVGEGLGICAHCACTLGNIRSG